MFPDETRVHRDFLLHFGFICVIINGIECFFDYGSENHRALCTTMEFSRYEIWSRAEQRYVPVTQERLETMGRQYADFLLHYDYQ